MPNFTADEVQTLSESVRKRKAIIEARLSPGITAASKELAWQAITEEVNAASNISRTADDIRRKWAAMKSATKSKVASQRRAVKRTGGGPPENTALTDVESNIVDLIGKETVEGVDGGFDLSMMMMGKH
jgi:hypothetical protein